MLEVLRLAVVVIVFEEIVVVMIVVVEVILDVVVVVIELVVLGFHDILLRVENMETPDQCSLCYAPGNSGEIVTISHRSDVQSIPFCLSSLASAIAAMAANLRSL